MTIYSHVVVCIDHETGKMWPDWDTTDARFNEGALFDTGSNEWHKSTPDGLPESDADKDAELCEHLSNLLASDGIETESPYYNLLKEIYEEISVGDGEMSYEMFKKVREFFELETDEE